MAMPRPASAPAEVPGDRPRGAPRRALAAGFSSFFLAFFLPSLAVELFGAWHGEGLSLLIRNIPWLVIGEAAIFIPIWVGLGQGRLWAVRAFRVAGWLLVLLCVVLFACAALMSSGVVAGTSRNWRFDVQYVFYFLLPLIVGAILLAHGLLRVAWLNPNSLPSEWEPPLLDGMPQATGSDRITNHRRRKG